MSWMWLQERLNDPEYKNWMKCGQALNLLNECLRPISKERMKSFHDVLKKKNASLKKCSTCEEKRKPADTCKTCRVWKADIFREHRSPAEWNNWKNVDPKNWPVDMWEVAKTYMPRGQKPGSYDPDISSVLNLMNMCKKFEDIGGRRISKALQIRNKVFHSINLKVSDGDSNEYLNAIQDLCNHLLTVIPSTSNIRGDILTNNKMVKQLKTSELNVDVNVPRKPQNRRVRYAASYDMEFIGHGSENLNQQQQIDVEQLEINLLSQCFKGLEERIEDIENQEKQDLKIGFQEFLDNNPDLSIRFNSTLAQIFRGDTANNEELSMDDFNQLLDDVSLYWERYGSVDMLKVLLADFDCIQVTKLQELTKPIDLFRLIVGNGLISQSNIDVLAEAAILCGLRGVESMIKKIVPTFRDFSKVIIRNFSDHRRNLLEFGMAMSIHNKDLIGNLYQLNVEKLTNPWCLLLELEDREILTANKKEFIRMLMRNGIKREAEALDRF